MMIDLETIGNVAIKVESKEDYIRLVDTLLAKGMEWHSTVGRPTWENYYDRYAIGYINIQERHITWSAKYKYREYPILISSDVVLDTNVNNNYSIF